jgi:phospholipid/cholesterol/gamma-HCH transport system substrate-binding protein
VGRAEVGVSSEAKTGIVALLVTAAVIISWSKLGGLSRLKGEYEVHVFFDDLHGLPVGAPVRLHGVRIGVVRDLDIARQPEFPQKLACAKLSIERRYTLYAGDLFQIASGSLLGDKHVKVSRGERAGAALDKGKISVVEGAAPSGIEALTADAEVLADQAQSAMTSLNELMSDQQVRADLKATLANMRLLSAKATQVAAKALQLVDRLGPEESAKVEKMVDNLYEVSQSVRRMAAGMNAMVATSTTPQDLDRITGNLAQASENVRRSMEAVEGVVADPKTSEDLRATLENVRQVSDQGIEIAKQTSSVLEHADSIAAKVDTAIGGLPSLTSPFREWDSEGQVDFRVGDADSGRIDLALDLFPRKFDDAFWRVGVRDVGGAETLDLQRGIPLRHRGERLRVGVFENKLGVGWDREWSSRLSSELELLDPDQFRVDVKGRYRYDEDWDLLFGIDRALSGTEPFVGARRHFDF